MQPLEVKTPPFAVDASVLTALRQTIQNHIPTLAMSNFFNPEDEKVYLAMNIDLPKGETKKYCILDHHFPQQPIPLLADHLQNCAIHHTGLLMELMPALTAGTKKLFFVLGKVTNDEATGLHIQALECSDAPVKFCYARDLIPLVMTQDATGHWGYDDTSSDLLALDINRIFPDQSLLLSLFQGTRLSALLPAYVAFGLDTLKGIPCVTKYRMMAHPDLGKKYNIYPQDPETRLVRQTVEGTHTLQDVFYLNPDKPLDRTSKDFHEPEFVKEANPYCTQLTLHYTGIHDLDYAFQEGKRLLLAQLEVLQNLLRSVTQSLTTDGLTFVSIVKAKPNHVKLFFNRPPSDYSFLARETIFEMFARHAVAVLTEDYGDLVDWQKTNVAQTMALRTLPELTFNIQLQESLSVWEVAEQTFNRMFTVVSSLEPSS